MPPQEWKDMAMAIAKSMKRKGMAKKEAESSGYAIATSKFEKKYHKTPQSMDKK